MLSFEHPLLKQAGRYDLSSSQDGGGTFLFSLACRPSFNIKETTKRRMKYEYTIPNSRRQQSSKWHVV